MTQLARSLVVGLCVMACAPGADKEGPNAASAAMSSSSTGSQVVMTSGPGATTVMTKLDVGDNATTQDTDPDGMDMSGCDKVDFLFVIDNSGSMSEEQSQLVANFPGFIQTIQDTLDEAQDYHIMVVDTDNSGPLDCGALCESECVVDGVCNLFNAICALTVCLPLGECEAAGSTCASPIPPDPCDVFGAGVVHPIGSAASNTQCNFSSGGRYMDSTEPDLEAAFQCAALVGTGASAGAEQPMGAMVQAVSPSTPAFACNEGFVRDDAILVVTIITDEDDNAGDGSQGTVEGWRQALIAAKGGDENAIVALGLFGGGACAEASPRLEQFTSSWGERGLQGSICAGSYQEFFQDAVNLIDTTCEDFVPPVPAG